MILIFDVNKWRTESDNEHWGFDIDQVLLLNERMFPLVFRAFLLSQIIILVTDLYFLLGKDQISGRIPMLLSYVVKR